MAHVAPATTADGQANVAGGSSPPRTIHATLRGHIEPQSRRARLDGQAGDHRRAGQGLARLRTGRARPSAAWLQADADRADQQLGLSRRASRGQRKGDRSPIGGARRPAQRYHEGTRDLDHADHDPQGHQARPLSDRRADRLSDVQRQRRCDIPHGARFAGHDHRRRARPTGSRRRWRSASHVTSTPPRPAQRPAGRELGRHSAVRQIGHVAAVDDRASAWWAGSC